jgi:hypothetical protein
MEDCLVIQDHLTTRIHLATTRDNLIAVNHLAIMDVDHLVIKDHFGIMTHLVTDNRLTAVNHLIATKENLAVFEHRLSAMHHGRVIAVWITHALLRIIAKMVGRNTIMSEIM